LTGGTTGERTTGETSTETVNSAAAKEGLAALGKTLDHPFVAAWVRNRFATSFDVLCEHLKGFAFPKHAGHLPVFWP
jgi:hypothetical protein